MKGFIKTRYAITHGNDYGVTRTFLSPIILPKYLCWTKRLDTVLFLMDFIILHPYVYCGSSCQATGVVSSNVGERECVTMWTISAATANIQQTEP